MARSARSIPAARTRLRRELVLRAAMKLADGDGIEAVTMRRLGQELGVEAMSLYNHVAGKDDVLAGMVDLVVGEIELPGPGSDWKAALRATAISAHETLMRHPWAAGLMMSGGQPHSARLRYMEALLGSLRSGGFSPELTHLAYHAIESHIVGFTLWLVGVAAAMRGMQGSIGSFLEALPVDEFPYLAEHVEQHLGGSGSRIDAYRFGLDLVLDGLERARGTG